ncbi:MAG: histidinol-phosphate transaminase [Desulfurococcaceae archaeon]
MLRLHMNESPYPPSALAVEYARKYVEYMNIYDVEGLREELIVELEKYTNLPREHIEFFPGSSYILLLMVALAKAQNIEVVLPHPTFHALYPVLRSFNANYAYVKLTQRFELDKQVFLRSAENRLVYLANPNNPTGNLLVEDPSYISKLAQVARYVFVDEAYYEFSGSTVKDLVVEHENVAVLRSLSKAFSLAGARFGYLLAGKRVKEHLNSLRIGFETPIMTQAAALGALRDRKYVEKIVEEVKSTRDYVRRKLLEVGLWSPESRANFILVDLGKPCREAWEKLSEHGILTLCLELVKDLVDYGNYLRVTVGKPDDMNTFLEKILEVL